MNQYSTTVTAPSSSSFDYSGARTRTSCRLKVSDFHQYGDQATIRLHEKGGKHRTHRPTLPGFSGLGVSTLTLSVLRGGPLISATAIGRSQKLSKGPMNEATLYRLMLIFSCGSPARCVKLCFLRAPSPKYSPHNLRATTTTLLLDALLGMMYRPNLSVPKRVLCAILKMNESPPRAAPIFVEC